MLNIVIALLLCHVVISLFTYYLSNKCYNSFSDDNTLDSLIFFFPLALLHWASFCGMLVPVLAGPGSVRLLLAVCSICALAFVYNLWGIWFLRFLRNNDGEGLADTVYENLLDLNSVAYYNITFTDPQILIANDPPVPVLSTSANSMEATSTQPLLMEHDLEFYE